MHVVHESPRRLEMQSPAICHRFEYTAIRLTSAALCGVSSFCVVSGIINPEIPAPPFDLLTAGLVCGFFGGLGIWASIGPHPLAHDLNLRFDGRSECLIVTQDKTERRFTFSRIAGAEVSVDPGDDMGGFRLRILMSDPDEVIQANDWFPELDACRLLAERINHFLQRHRTSDTSVVNLNDTDLRNAYHGRGSNHVRHP